MTDSPQPITSPLEEKDPLLPQELYFCNSLDLEEENQEQITEYGSWDTTEFADKFSVRSFERYLINKGVHDLKQTPMEEEVKIHFDLSWILYFDKINLNNFLEGFYDIFGLSEEAILVSKLTILKRSFNMYNNICKLESEVSGSQQDATEYFRKCSKNVLLPKLENFFGKDLLGSFHQISEKKLHYAHADTPKEYNVFSKYQSDDNEMGSVHLSRKDYNIFTLERKNPNLEDIFFALNDFLPQNSIGRTNCTIIWERSTLCFEDKHAIESLNLCCEDSWRNFFGNLIDFFCVTGFTPLQEQINKSQRSQEINMMKITANLADDSQVLRRPIKKLPKRTVAQNTSGNEDVANPKRQYLKRAKYWTDRKNPQHQELTEWSRKLMEEQKEKDRKGSINS